MLLFYNFFISFSKLGCDYRKSLTLADFPKNSQAIAVTALVLPEHERNVDLRNISLFYYLDKDC